MKLRGNMVMSENPQGTQETQTEQEMRYLQDVKLSQVLHAKFTVFSDVFKSPARPKSHLDVIKIIAIIFVLLNHTGVNLFTQYTKESGTIAHWLMLGHAIVIKTAVPLFFMSSGALLLGRDEPYSVLFKKRILRFMLTLLAVSALTYIGNAKSLSNLSVEEFFSQLYRGKISTHLWYLYAYICLLLTIPFLRKIAQQMSEKDFYWLIVLQVIYSGVEFADYYFYRGSGAHSWAFSIFTATRALLYPLLGFYMENRMPKEKYQPETFIILAVLMIMSVYLSCVMMEWRCKVDGGWTSSNQEAYLDSLVVFPTVTIYYAARLWFLKHPASEKMGKILFHIGSYTFGVYLFEGFFRKWAMPVRDILRKKTSLYFATWVQILAAVALGLAATFLYKTLVGLLTLGVKRLFKRNGE